jgi:hypothetical protein
MRRSVGPFIESCAFLYIDTLSGPGLTITDKCILIHLLTRRFVRLGLGPVLYMTYTGQLARVDGRGVRVGPGFEPC